MPMSITFTCKCGKSVQVKDEYAGREGECPSCGRAVMIPEAEDEGHITEQAPLPKPKAKAAETAPWMAPQKKVEHLPEPDEDDTHLTTHAGGFIEEEDDFFVEAPKEIGRLHSAFTTLKKHQDPMSPGMRVVLVFTLFGVSAVITALVIVLIILLAGARWRFEQFAMLLLFPSAVGLLAGAIGYWWTGFSHTCTYVGTKGIARFVCSGSREYLSTDEVFLYRDATELRIAQTRHYYNGVYTGTDYSFAWSNERGDVIHTIAGRYSSEEGNPVATDPYHYAIMAENAWTMFLFRDIERILEEDKLLFFGLKGGDYIELGEGLFILHQGGKKIKLKGNKIDKMTIGNGIIQVWEVGAQEGWFTNSGIHQFMYADLGNARFFMFALEKLLGIRF
jgi:hypothetical protein